MLNITMNQEKNGIEIRFDCRPDAKVLSELKENGFRWSSRQKIWYAKQSDSRMSFVNQLSNQYGISMIDKVNTETNNSDGYDLWEMTRIADDANNVDESLSTKEIASRIRKHIRNRFPMCRWSITSSIHSIDVSLFSAPWAKDSDEMSAILNYVEKYVASFRYCTCYDPYGDYGSSYNFYGVYANNIISWKFEQREMTVAELGMSQVFQSKKIAFDEAEQERKEKEFQERMAQYEIEKAEYVKLEAERKARHEVIENSARIVEDSYFVLNCDTTNTRKENSVDDYTDDCDGEFEVKHHRENCQVTREVHFTPEAYELFSNQLMDDYTFLTGMGGSRTDDYRINSDQDYHMMTKEERTTVEWYNCNCVAIFCDEILRLVINPEGYDYARYTYFVDGDSTIVRSYAGNTGISKEEACANRLIAECIEDHSTEIIMNGNYYGNTWNTDKSEEYGSQMKEWIYENDIKLTKAIIAAIEIPELKTRMYKIYEEIKGIQEQFKRANFQPDQKITVIQMSDFGGISVNRGYFKSFRCDSYAQYKNAVKLIIRPEKKRQDYYSWLYRDVLIYDGWHELPEDLFWETIESESGVTIKHSRFLSCDMEQYQVILEYFKNNGIYPIINTLN